MKSRPTSVLFHLSKAPLFLLILGAAAATTIPLTTTTTVAIDGGGGGGSGGKISMFPFTPWKGGLGAEFGRVFYRGYNSTGGPITWLDAYLFCKGLGKNTELAKVLNDKQMDNLLHVVDSPAWIAGNDLMEEGKFAWDIWGKEPMRVTRWGKGQPKKGGRCVEVQGVRRNFNWQTRSCDRKIPNVFGAICQIGLPLDKEELEGGGGGGDVTTQKSATLHFDVATIW